MKRFVCSRHLNVESSDRDGIILLHGLLGSRVQVTEPTFRFLKLFEQPKALEELADFGDVDKVRPQFERLLKGGFLVAEGHTESIYDKALQSAQPGFFGMQPAKGHHQPPDVVFLGVPFDYGNHKEPGTRHGPDALRRQSLELHYTLDTKTGTPRGWYDNATGRKVLQGVWMSDAGNLFAPANENPQRVFEKLRKVVAGILGDGAMPVVVGGDHSITYPILAAYDQPLSIIQIDAHSDLAPYHTGIENHHGNVMSRALGLEHVENLYQLGLRGTTEVSQLDFGSRIPQALAPQKIRSLGAEGVLQAIPKAGDYYLTLDIDALDPIYAPGTSTPVPGGLTFDEVKELLVVVGRHRKCVGFDLVEVNPQKDVNNSTAAVALELLLAFTSACFETGKWEDDA